LDCGGVRTEHLGNSSVVNLELEDLEGEKSKKEIVENVKPKLNSR